MSRVDSTLGKVRVLKTSVLNVLDSHEWILWKKESLAHKRRHLIVGHRANRGTQLAMNLRSACLFQIEMIPALLAGRHSGPRLLHHTYVRMDMIQDSTRLQMRAGSINHGRHLDNHLQKKASVCFTDSFFIQFPAGGVWAPPYTKALNRLFDWKTSQCRCRWGIFFQRSLYHTSQHWASGCFFQQKRQLFSCIFGVSWGGTKPEEVRQEAGPDVIWRLADAAWLHSFRVWTSHCIYLCLYLDHALPTLIPQGYSALFVSILSGESKELITMMKARGTVVKKPQVWSP